MIVITVQYELNNESQNERFNMLEKDILKVEKTLNMTKNQVDSISYGGQVIQCELGTCKEIVKPHWIKTEQVCNENYCGELTIKTDSTTLKDALNP